MTRKVKENEVKKILKDNKAVLVDSYTWEVIDYDSESYKKPKKITPKWLFFKKMLHITNKSIAWMIWSADHSKLNILLDTLDFDNTIDFWCLEDLYSSTSIKNFRSKIWKIWFVKKKSSRWYMNPIVAIKWWEIDPVLSDLFKKDNKSIYWITKL